MKKIFLTFFYILLIVKFLGAANKRVVIDSVNVNSEILSLSFTVDGIIDEKIKEGLLKGLTSTIEYQIQLWDKKSGIINNLVTQQDIRIKIFFDNWENKFIIMSSEEKRLTQSIETVRERCSQMVNYEIINTNELDKDGMYFITVKAILRPLSVENYQEIKKWLSGEAKNFDLKKLGDTDKQEKRVKGGLFKMFMALTGFGDRVITGKCNKFKIQENKINWYQE